MCRTFGSGEEAAGAWSFSGENAARVGEVAGAQGEAAAADALGEVVAQPLELVDSVVEPGPPAGGQVSPVFAGGVRSRGNWSRVPRTSANAMLLLDLKQC